MGNELTAETVARAVHNYCRGSTRKGSMAKGFTTTEIQIADNDNGRLDVVAWWPKTNTTWIEGFEIKVTRSDFLDDVRSGKYRRYLDYCDGFWFAVAEGVATASEVPQEIGFMVVRPDGTSRTYRRPRPTNKRIDGRQMDRIATRLTEIVGRRLEREDELERVALMMRHMSDLAQSRDPLHSPYWGKWLSAGVRERIRRADIVTENERAIIESAHRKAEALIERAKETNVDKRLERFDDAELLLFAATGMLLDGGWGMKRRLEDARAVIDRVLAEVGPDR